MTEIIRFSDFGPAFVYAKGIYRHHLTLKGPSHPDLRQWCVERFGPDAITRDNWSLDYTIRGTTFYYLNCDHKWTFTYTTFIFEQPDMLFEFKMRWY